MASTIWICHQFRYSEPRVCKIEKLLRNKTKQSISAIRYKFKLTHFIFEFQLRSSKCHGAIFHWNQRYTCEHTQSRERRRNSNIVTCLSLWIPENLNKKFIHGAHQTIDSYFTAHRTVCVFASRKEKCRRYNVKVCVVALQTEFHICIRTRMPRLTHTR